MDDTAAEMWDLFVQESEDYLAQIEANLSGSASDLENPETMAALFRAFHSLKGVSASLGLTGVESIAHAGEDLLDLFRGGEARPDDASLDLLLQANDALVDLREACIDARQDIAADAQLIGALQQAKAALKSGGSVAPSPVAPAAPPVAAAPPLPSSAPSQAPAPPSTPPAPPPAAIAEPEEEEEPSAHANQSRMAIQVSQDPADPRNPSFSLKR